MPEENLSNMPEARTSEGIAQAFPGTDVYHLATQVFGSHDPAYKWLTSPAMGLNQCKPIDLVKTESGILAVMTLLARMEHGVYC